jgi:hypothetical protein
MAIIGAALSFAATHALALDPAQWQKETAKAYAECSFGAKIVRIGREAGPKDFQDSRACVESKIDIAKANFQSVVPVASPGGAPALKDYFAAWIGAMRSIPSFLNMSKRAADMADASNTQRLNELWARYEIGQ